VVVVVVMVVVVVVVVWFLCDINKDGNITLNEQNISVLCIFTIV
jgi:hypothetical protein